MPKKHVLAICAVVVVAVAAAWLMPGRSKAPSSAVPGNQQAQVSQAPANGNGSPSVEFAGTSQPMPLPLVGQSQPVMRGPLAEAAAGITEGDDGVPLEGSSAVPPTVTSTAPPAGVPATPEPAPAPRPTPAPTQVASAKPAPAPAAKPTPTPAAKPAPVATPPDKPQTVAKAATGNWYTGQAAGNYVLQILGTSSEASAQNFIKEQGGEYRYFKKVLNGKPLYVVTYGSFSSRDAAVNAIKNLPAKVQAGKPWPRTIASVQQELAVTR